MTKDSLWSDCVSLTPSGQKLVEEHLQLAQAAARKAYKRAHHHGIDYDTIVSQAYMGLIRGVADWDQSKSPNKSEGLKPYLVQHVNWYILRLWRDSCDSKLVKFCGQQLPEENESNLLIAKDRSPADTRQELVEEIQTRMKSLTPRQQAVLLMVDANDMLQADVAEKLGCSRQAVSEILRKARRKFKRCLKAADKTPNREADVRRKDRFVRWQCDNRQASKDAGLKGCQRAAELRRQRTLLSAVLYKCLKSKWYGVDHESKTVTGPYRYRHQAESRLARLGHKGGAEHGWPNIGNMEAAALKLISETPSTIAEITRRLGFSPPSVRTFIYRLQRRGYTEAAEYVSRPVGVHGGRGGRRWKATQKAVDVRVKPLVGVMGREAQRLLDSGYTPVLAVKLKGRSYEVAS